jgi:hypothetical protein
MWTHFNYAWWVNDPIYSILAAREGSDFRKKPRRSIAAPSATGASHCNSCSCVVNIRHCDSFSPNAISVSAPRRACTFKERAMHWSCQPRPVCLGRPLLHCSEVHWFNTRWHQLVNRVGCYYRVQRLVHGASQITVWLLYIGVNVRSVARVYIESSTHLASCN